MIRKKMEDYQYFIYRDTSRILTVMTGYRLIYPEYSGAIVDSWLTCLYPSYYCSPKMEVALFLTNPHNCVFSFLFG